MVDFDPLHQPGNDHVLGLRVGLVEGVRPGKQIGHFLGGSLRCVLFLFHLGFGLFHPALGGFQLFFVLRHHGVHDADVHGVLPREELHGLILQGVHLLILEEAEIKPYRIKYYCENRDPEFDGKMHNVLLVYKQLSMQFDKDGNFVPWPEDGEHIHVLSYDEKPGIQAIATTSPDLLPKHGNGSILRDYEYRRLGTLSLLAGIDLQTGEAIPLIRESHNSDDYIDFLKILDAKYPKGDKIRLVLDNLKVHTSEATKEYLTTVPGRFEFVFTPKHGSWLNMVEGFFSKMTKQMLRGIRVNSKQELADRIYKYFDEVNADPVVFHWKYKLDDIDVSEEPHVETLLPA